MYCYIDVGGFL